MNLQQYFADTTGFGTLSTADALGHVNSAVYARPHCFADGTLGFIMPDKLTHRNLGDNAHAVYAFREDPGKGERRYAGKRIYLRKVSEDSDEKRIAALRRRTYAEDKAGRYLVIFEVEKELPLVGADESEATALEA